MGALLGVAQGSERPPRVVVMRWRGGRAKDQAGRVVGKGVVFDTGGISIKPAAGMEDMKGDMGGAAAVSGLMRTLALRKAKANAVGIVGLVENMPDGKAQRPGDIVTSMSGQTIEVINTDAEGRLVLADLLTYVQRNEQPAAMIDLATLTGAIIVALGNQHAGLFSNNDALADELLRAGTETGEMVWRMPLGPEYDKLDGFQSRRHEEHRRAQRRLDHRRAVHPALCRERYAVGASRRCGDGDGLAGERDQPVLGFGLGRAAARRIRARAVRAQEVLRPVGSAGVSMAEILFYHLERQPLESALPGLLQRSLDRGWRVVVKVGSDERLEALNAHLWSFDDASFLPHGAAADGHAEAQPIWLTTGDDNPNGANVAFWSMARRRTDPCGLRAHRLHVRCRRPGGGGEGARRRGRRQQAAGHDATYWRQDENGRWTKQAG